MACCDTVYKSFVNETSTTIPFAGVVPTVTVQYLINGEWNVSVATSVTIANGIVTVDHGGPATGIIKLS